MTRWLENIQQTDLTQSTLHPARLLSNLALSAHRIRECEGRACRRSQVSGCLDRQGRRKGEAQISSHSDTRIRNKGGGALFPTLRLKIRLVCTGYEVRNWAFQMTPVHESTELGECYWVSVGRVSDILCPPGRRARSGRDVFVGHTDIQGGPCLYLPRYIVVELDVFCATSGLELMLTVLFHSFIKIESSTCSIRIST